MSGNVSSVNESLNAFIHENDRGNGKYVSEVVSKDIEDAVASLLYRAQDKSVVENGLSSWATIKKHRKEMSRKLPINS